MNMPWRSTPSAFGELGAHDDRARDGIDARIHVRDDARERAVGQAGRGRRHRQAAAQHEQVRLRNREVELDDGRVVERRDHGAGAHEAADADVPEAGSAVERRADHGVVEPRLRGGDARFVGFQRRLDLLEIRDRQRLARLQIAAAVVLALAARERRFGLGERGSRLRVVHLDEHGAALDFLAFLEPDRRDGVRRLRRDLDGLVRLRRADGFDLDAHRLDARGLRDDGDRRGSGCGRGGAGLGRRLRAALHEQQRRARRAPSAGRRPRYAAKRSCADVRVPCMT